MDKLNLILPSINTNYLYIRKLLRVWDRVTLFLIKSVGMLNKDHYVLWIKPLPCKGKEWYQIWTIYNPGQNQGIHTKSLQRKYYYIWLNNFLCIYKFIYVSTLNLEPLNQNPGTVIVYNGWRKTKLSSNILQPCINFPISSRKHLNKSKIY